MPRSAYILGRRANCEAFKRCQENGGYFTVSAYEFRKGMRYTDPVTAPPSTKSKIKYRIRVHPKSWARDILEELIHA